MRPDSHRLNLSRTESERPELYEPCANRTPNGQEFIVVMSHHR